MFNVYPYINENDLNLDYLLKKMKSLVEAMANFEHDEKFKFADPITFNIMTQYERGTIVLDSNGDAYLSLKPTVGKPLSNGEYWQEIFDFAVYVRTANENLTLHIETGTTRATAAYAVDDWLLWDDVLYKVTAAITSDDLLEIGTNIERFTVEQFCRAWVLYANALIVQYKNDIDASELLYRQQLAGDIASTTASLQAQLDAAIAGATVDSEVILARVSYDNITYATLGDHLRDKLGLLRYFGRGKIDDGVMSFEFSDGYILTTLNSTVNFGDVVSNAYWHYALIACEAGDKFKITAGAYGDPSGYAVIDDTYTVIAKSGSPLSNYNLTIPAGGVYLLVCANTSVNPIYKVTRNLVPTLESGVSTNTAAISTINNTLQDMEDAEKDIIDISITSGYYQNFDGNNHLNAPTADANWSTATASCSEQDIFLISGRGVTNPPTYAWLDNTDTIISSNGNTALTDQYIIAPTGAVKLICNNATNLYADGLSLKKLNHSPVIVGTKGCFTSFTEALYKTTKDIRVTIGTYDVVQEYKDLFGNDIFNNISDSYVGIGNFKYGPWIENRKVTFDGGAQIVSDLTGDLWPDATHRFSALNFGINAELYGAVVAAKGFWYVLHDDVGGTYDISHNVVENCILTGTYVRMYNVIGGGTGRRSHTLIKNSYLDNGGSGTESLRYHNNNNADAAPVVIVEGCYANGEINARWYGSQATPKMTFIAHHNECAGVNKLAESGLYNVDNVDLITWYNKTS